MAEQVSHQTFDVELTGCRPEPLASYLKALGVLRLVGDQKDDAASGFWQGEHFILRSSLDREALARFFVETWRPTPVIAPWNGGSGFYPKDSREAADAIVAAQDGRLHAFAEAIGIGRAFVAEMGWTERPADDKKVLMLSTMRARLPDESLAWLDAAVMLGDDRLLFPPLLGTGGNDGRLDFSNNYQQRVVQVLTPGAGNSLESSLFGTTTMSRFKGAMGQYQPAASERTNPWDFVLLIEGALLFSAAATRRYETSSPAKMAFPFHARSASGLSTVTDSDEGEGRDELWLPLWSSPSTIREIRRLFAEGRANVGSGDTARTASSALDFARAVTSLGVDRGIDAFARVGFHVRNGLAYFATPLGRFTTREVRSARLLDDIDRWFESFRRKTTSSNVPARIATARRRLELAMFEAARTGSLGPVLLDLGEAERAMAGSLGFAEKAFLTPPPQLGSAWATAIDDGSIEQRLAAALAARPGIHRRLVPLDKGGRKFGRGDDPGVVFTDRPLVENLHALLLRDDLDAMQQDRPGAHDALRARCSLTDIACFIDGDVDDVLIERWLRALVLIDGGVAPRVPESRVLPPAAYAVLFLVHRRLLGEAPLPRTTGVLTRACAGDAEGATRAAIRRLNASARPFPVDALFEQPARARRIAAALAFPLTIKQRRALESMVLPAVDPSSGTTTGSAQEHA